MKNILLIVLILVASVAQATKRYASPTGGGNGTIGSPWTIIIACANASSGDTIVPTNGTYIITTRLNIPLGVSIIGSDSANVIFNCSFSDANFALESADLSHGNQLLQGFTLNGNMVGSIGIYIKKRHNVDCNAISVKNFRNRGINNMNPTAGGPPFVIGCDITNSRIVNCAHHSAGGSFGNVWYDGVKDYIIRNNYIEASYRAGDSAGYALKVISNANCIIDSNDIRVINHNDNARAAFALECNHNWGGVTIRNNNFQGQVDFAGYMTIQGIYAYSMKFLYNSVGHPELTPYLQVGMRLEYQPATGREGLFEGAEIAYNRIKNVTYGIIIESNFANILQNVNIHHNIFAPLGVLGQTYNYGVGISNSSSGVIAAVIRDLYIDNNVFIASTVDGTRQSAAIELPAKITGKNIRVRNNIMIGFDNAAIMTRYATGTLDSVYIQNNISFGNANNNEPRWFGITPNRLFSIDNLKIDPLFVRANADYHLQTASPAIDAGLNIGYDYLYARPDIGAFEYKIDNPVVLPTVLLFEPVNKTSISIILNAKVANDGGGTISEKGICYGTNPNPTTTGNKISAGNGISEFDIMVPGLNNSTTYYIRSYAINEAGTAYSPQLIVTTKPSSKMDSNGKSMRH